MRKRAVTDNAKSSPRDAVAGVGESVKVHGRFADVGIPIRVISHEGEGRPADLAGKDHGHDFVELILFHGGRGTHRVQGRELPVVAGNVFAIHGDQVHAIGEREGLRYTEVHFNTSRIPFPAEHLRKLPGYRALFELEPRTHAEPGSASYLRLTPTRLAHALRITTLMHEELLTRAAGYEVLLLARLLELIVYLSREYEVSGAGESRALIRVSRVIREIEAACQHPWRLDELAAKVGLARSQFESVFNEATGQPPLRYLSHLRLRRAMELLESTNRTVTEIAHQVGFYDSNHMARKFREVLKVTPLQHRRLRRS